MSLRYYNVNKYEMPHKKRHAIKQFTMTKIIIQRHTNSKKHITLQFILHYLLYRKTIKNIHLTQ